MWTLLAKASEAVEGTRTQNMLRDEADQMDCVLKINSGAGGTESQDWASMLMRMYLRYAWTNGYKATIANLQEGDRSRNQNLYYQYWRWFCIWLFERRERCAPSGSCFSIQCAKANAWPLLLLCSLLRWWMTVSSKYSACQHLLGYIPKRWCRWTECK